MVVASYWAENWLPTIVIIDIFTIHDDMEIGLDTRRKTFNQHNDGAYISVGTFPDERSVAPLVHSKNPDRAPPH